MTKGDVLVCRDSYEPRAVRIVSSIRHERVYYDYYPQGYGGPALLDSNFISKETLERNPTNWYIIPRRIAVPEGL